MRKTNDTLYIGGRNPVREALMAGQIEALFVKMGETDKKLNELIREAEKRDIPVINIKEQQLSALCDSINHQGVVAQLPSYECASLEDILDSAEPNPILVLLDGVEDVRNLGAIVRTAECAGITAVLIPKHKSAKITAAAIKTAAGAFSYFPVCQIGNIRQTLVNLKEKGFWVVGADMDGDSIYETDLKGPLVIVMGGEGKGIRPLTKKMCDFMAAIPMKGKVSSLNVSVAAALFIYEAIRQRK